MGNCSREMGTVKKNQMEMLEIKGSSEVKDSFEKLNDRLATWREESVNFKSGQ